MHYDNVFLQVGYLDRWNLIDCFHMFSKQKQRIVNNYIVMAFSHWCVKVISDFPWDNPDNHSPTSPYILREQSKTTSAVICLSLAHWGRENSRLFADDVFKYVFLDGSIWISLQISLKFAFNIPINNIPSLVQITDWRNPSNTWHYSML